MKRVIITSISLLLLAITGCAQWELKDAVEFQQRNGLPNFFSKVQNNEAVKVGFIGGSITKAEGWRPKTVSMLKEFYKIDDMVDYHAAISGTNSKFGVFRMDSHLLSKQNFDLIFVEFAVNDKNDDPDEIVKSMEGIVRKIWKKNPHTDICFVYTVSYKFLPDIENGKMNLSATIHDSVASYYGIPSIFWGVEANIQVQKDNVVWSDAISNYSTSQNEAGQYVFTTDKTHPTDFGHQVYADVLLKCFKKMDDNHNVYEHEIKTPIDKKNYENSEILTPNMPNNHGMVVIDEIGEKSYLDKFINEDTWFLVSENPDAYYSFSFVGSEFGIMEMKGPSSGKYIVEIDGNKREFNSFDGYCSYWRAGNRFIKLSEHREHFVKIYASKDQLSLSEKREILNAEKRKLDLDKNPDEYEYSEYIFSNILLDGELTYYYAEDLKVCDGDTLIWRDKEFTESGQYFDKVETSTDYDSVYQLNLTVCPTYYSIEYETIADGDSLFCPTSDQISLIWNEVPQNHYDITLTNTNGVLFYTESLLISQTDKSIDMSSFPSGIYFLIVRSIDNNRYSSYKIMKI